ncbi:MAG: hypothetical protein NTX53_05580 [candidate division WOR-3 bacterium]|nr:hypothetical protein [candidate division WOR-3 bacterium]
MLREFVSRGGVEGRQRRFYLAFAHKYDRLLRRSGPEYPPGGARRLFAQYGGMGLDSETLWRICHMIEALRTGVTA